MRLRETRERRPDVGATVDLDPVDSVPRFAWGKFFEDGEFLRMPLSVQAHHALMDGIHMGSFHAKVQDYLDHPDSVLGETR